MDEMEFAFPQVIAPDSGSPIPIQSGMTLHDYVATAVITALVGRIGAMDDERIEYLVNTSFKVADAFLMIRDENFQKLQLRTFAEES